MRATPSHNGLGAKEVDYPRKGGNRLPGCWQHHNYSNGFPSEKQAEFDTKCPGAVKEQHRGISYFSGEYRVVIRTRGAVRIMG